MFPVACRRRRASASTASGRVRGRAPHHPDSDSSTFLNSGSAFTTPQAPRKVMIATHQPPRLGAAFYPRFSSRPWTPAVASRVATLATRKSGPFRRSHDVENTEPERASTARTDSEELSTSYAAAEVEVDTSPRSANILQQAATRLAKAAAVAGLCVALAMSSVSPALAARSGGVMGGSSFSSRSSPGTSFGGSSLGGSSFGGSSRMGPSLSSGPGVMGPNMLSLRRGPGLRSSSFGWFGPPVYYGGGYGYGAPVGGGGGGFGNILLLGVLAAILWTAFTSFSGDSAGGEYAGEKVTVAKLQVGLLGSARQMKRDLERIADRANTDSPSGLHYILQETVLALLRHPDYCVYASSSTANKRGLEAGESAFNQLSMEERSKFKQETLVNVSGRRRSSTYSGGSGKDGTNELIVVTLLVAVEGGVKLPNVRSLEELRSALSSLGSIGTDQTLAVEVLWTPQDDGDYYTRDDIFQDYPTLNNL